MESEMTLAKKPVNKPHYKAMLELQRNKTLRWKIRAIVLGVGWAITLLIALL